MRVATAVKNKTNDLLDEIETVSRSLEASIKRLLKLSKHRDSEVRMRSVEAMVRLHDAEIDSRIVEALADDEELVRVTALEVIASWGNRSWADHILGSLSDNSELVRSAAAIAVAEIAAEAATLELEKKLPAAQDEERVSILYGLYKLGKRDYLSPFLSGLSHSFYRVRCATANLSCSITDDANREMITSALEAALTRETTRAARSSIEHALSEIRPSGRSS